MNEKTAPAHARLFVAIGIPEAVRDEIQSAQTKLRRAVPAGGIRWTPRDQFHLTLRFLGNVDVERIERLAKAVRMACASFRPLSLRAGGIGFFPSPQRPRVVWAGIKDADGNLARLQEAIQTATSDFTAEEPETQFSGHATLGRVKKLRPAEVQALAEAAAGLADCVFGEWNAPEVELVQSELSATGARHRCRASIPLGG